MNINDKIEEIREELNQLAVNNMDILTMQSIVELSQRLDILIAESYRNRLPVKYEN